MTEVSIPVYVLIAVVLFVFGFGLGATIGYVDRKTADSRFGKKINAKTERLQADIRRRGVDPDRIDAAIDKWSMPVLIVAAVGVTAWFANTPSAVLVAAVGVGVVAGDEFGRRRRRRRDGGRA